MTSMHLHQPNSHTEYNQPLYPWLVESKDVKPTDMEGQLYLQMIYPVRG